MITSSIIYHTKQPIPTSIIGFINSLTSSSNPNLVLFGDALYANLDILDYNLYHSDFLCLAGAYSTDGEIYGFNSNGNIITVGFSRNSKSWAKSNDVSYDLKQINSPTLENFAYNQSFFGYIKEAARTYPYEYTEIFYELTTAFPRTNLTIDNGSPTESTLSWSNISLIRPSDNTTNAEHILGLNGIVSGNNTKKIMSFRYQEIGNYSMQFYINNTDNIHINFKTIGDLAYEIVNDTSNKIEKVRMTRYRQNIYIEITGIDINTPYIKLRNESNQTTFIGNVNSGVKLGHFNIINLDVPNYLQNYVYRFINPFTKEADIFAPIPVTQDTIVFYKSALKPLQTEVIFNAGTININSVLTNDKLYSFGYNLVGEILLNYIELLDQSDYTYDEVVLNNSWVNILNHPEFRNLLVQKKGVLVLPLAYKPGFVAGYDIENKVLVDLSFSRIHDNVSQMYSIYNNNVIAFNEHEIMYSDTLYNATNTGYLFETEHNIFDRHGDDIHTSLNAPITLSSPTNSAVHNIRMGISIENGNTNNTYRYSIINQKIIKIDNTINNRIYSQNNDTNDTVYYGATNTNTPDNKLLVTKNLNDGWVYIESMIFYQDDDYTKPEYPLNTNIGVEKVDDSNNAYGLYNFFNNRIVNQRDITNGNYSRKLIGEAYQANYYVGNDEMLTNGFYHVYTLGERTKFRHSIKKNIQEIVGNDIIYAIFLRDQ